MSQHDDVRIALLNRVLDEAEATHGAQIALQALERALEEAGLRGRLMEDVTMEAMLYACRMAEAAFELGWTWRGNPDLLFTQEVFKDYTLPAGQEME